MRVNRGAPTSRGRKGGRFLRHRVQLRAMAFSPDPAWLRHALAARALSSPLAGASPCPIDDSPAPP